MTDTPKKNPKIPPPIEFVDGVPVFTPGTQNVDPETPQKTRAEADAELLEIVENIRRLTEIVDNAKADLAGAYSSAKGDGYDKKALKQAIKNLESKNGQWELFAGTVDTYDAAIKRAIKNQGPRRDVEKGLS